MLAKCSVSISPLSCPRTRHNKTAIATKSGNQQLRHVTHIWDQSLRAQQYIIPSRSNSQVTIRFPAKLNTLLRRILQTTGTGLLFCYNNNNNFKSGAFVLVLPNLLKHYISCAFTFLLSGLLILLHAFFILPLLHSHSAKSTDTSHQCSTRPISFIHSLIHILFTS